MLRVEIDVRLRTLRIQPDLAEYADVDSAHELLSDDIQAVCGMSADDEVVVFERSLAEAMVVIVVPVERLTEEVQAVQLVQTLNVGGIASSVLLIDADLVGCEAGLFGLFYGHSDAAIVDAQRFPRSVDFRARILPEDILFQERAIKPLDRIRDIDIFYNRRVLGYMSSAEMVKISSPLIASCTSCDESKSKNYDLQEDNPCFPPSTGLFLMQCLLSFFW